MMTPLSRMISAVCLFLGLAFCGYGQQLLDERVTLPARTVTLQQLLEETSRQTPIVFSHGRIPANTKITFAENNVTIQDIIREIKSATGLNYKVTGHKVLLIPPARRSTMTGYIRDSGNGESLPGANIFTSHDLQGTTSNNYGFFSLTTDVENVSVTVSYVGYETQTHTFYLREDTTMIINLRPQVLPEIVITDHQKVHELTRMSTIEVPIEEIRSMPAMGGEVDIMRSLQMLPGVLGGSDGSSGLYVRGGSPDQNLVLLDGVPVYNTNHMFGLLSVFNSDAINHIELIKGGFPARYGGRLSSVLDITMKDGNMQEVKGQGSIGLIASRLTVEGPIKKDKASFVISGRRTFADLISRPLQRLNTNGNNDVGFHFYDLNAKVNYFINKRNRIYLSAYSGGDLIKTYRRRQISNDSLFSKRVSKSNVGWNNLMSAFRWNNIISPKMFSSMVVTYSKYQLQTGSEFEETLKEGDTNSYEHYKTAYHSGIREIGFRHDFDFMASPNHYVRFGTFVNRHHFSPGALTYRVGAADSVMGSFDINNWEYGAYAEDDITLSSRLKANIGLHYAAVSVLGSVYGSLQPRLSMQFLINDKLSLKASYVEMQQNIHLLTNTTVGMPTDLWVPATPIAKPERSWQSALGLTYLPSDLYLVTFESYYKSMTNLIEYQNGASFMNVDKDWQTKIETGNGESYGTELFIKKNSGRLTGWVGYTLSWANRTFKNIDEGQTFPFKYDRRHDLETAVFYKLNNKIDLSFAWSFGSGYPISIPISKYPNHQGSHFNNSQGDEFIYHYPSRNNYRMRAFHRLDAMISFSKKKKWGEREWVIGLYNAYNRNNPFYVAIENNYAGKKPDDDARFVQYSLFPVIPSISYNFRF